MGETAVLFVLNRTIINRVTVRIFKQKTVRQPHFSGFPLAYLRNQSKIVFTCVRNGIIRQVRDFERFTVGPYRIGPGVTQATAFCRNAVCRSAPAQRVGILIGQIAGVVQAKWSFVLPLCLSGDTTIKRGRTVKTAKLAKLDSLWILVSSPKPIQKSHNESSRTILPQYRLSG
jgi:hypothetical protein